MFVSSVVLTRTAMEMGSAMRRPHEGFFLRRQALQKGREAPRPRIPVKTARVNRLSDRTLEDRPTVLAVGTSPRQMALITDAARRVHGLATGRAISADPQTVAGRAQRHAIIKEILALEPGPLRLRQHVVTPH